MEDISNRIVKGKYLYLVENIKVTEDNPVILFWLALPVNHKGQKIVIQSIKPTPNEIIEDPINGNRFIFWKITEFHDSHQYQFEYTFELLATDVEHEIEIDTILPYDQESELYRFYTKSEPWLEITPEIAQKAREIKGAQSNPYLCAKLFFDWVIANMVYIYPNVEDRGAAKSFRRLSGDCGEFSSVFIALCRSVGIPARSVTAVWAKESGHAWAEFYLEPYGWLPVDTTIAQVVDETFMNVIKAKNADRDYLFGNLYPNRLIVYIGCNVEIESKTEHLLRTFSFMQPGGGCSYPTSIEFTGISEAVIHAGFYLFDEEIEDEQFIFAKMDKEFAENYYPNEDPAKAEQGLLNIVNYNQDAVLSWFYLGQVYLKADSYDKAIECFLHSVDNDRHKLPEQALTWAYNLLGDCYMHKGMKAEAIESYQFVIDQDIDYQGALEYANKHLIEAQFMELDAHLISSD